MDEIGVAGFGGNGLGAHASPCEDSSSSIGHRAGARTALHGRSTGLILRSEGVLAEIHASSASPAKASTSADATNISMLTAATASWNHSAILPSPKTRERSYSVPN